MANLPGDRARERSLTAARRTSTRAVRIIRANDPDTVTPLAARSRAAVSDQGGWYEVRSVGGILARPADLLE